MLEFLETFYNSELIKKIPYTYGVFGGAIRSWILDRKPRDIDIAVDCTAEQLLAIVKDKEHDTNRFGGIKIKDANHEFDLWPLSETWSLKNEKVDATFENLARYASFNVDCIVLEVPNIYSSVANRPRVISHNFFESIQKGVVEVNYAPNPIAPYNAVRGLRICKTYAWKPGKSLIDYVKEHVTEKNKPILGLRYQKTYGESIDDLWKIVE